MDAILVFDGNKKSRFHIHPRLYGSLTRKLWPKLIHNIDPSAAPKVRAVHAPVSACVQRKQLFCTASGPLEMTRANFHRNRAAEVDAATLNVDAQRSSSHHTTFIRRPGHCQILYYYLFYYLYF
jgi:hypothetical protein